MKCSYPIIRTAIEDGSVTVKEMATLLDEEVEVINQKLCGADDFDINEAMVLNTELFPEVPFKELFTKQLN